MPHKYKQALAEISSRDQIIKQKDERISYLEKILIDHDLLKPEIEKVNFKKELESDREFEYYPELDNSFGIKSEGEAKDETVEKPEDWPAFEQVE